MDVPLADRRFSHSLGPHRGVTLLETVAATAVLAACALLVAQALDRIAVQRRTAERRELALLEAANLMERLTLSPWDELSEERLSAEEAAGLERLPGAQLKIGLARASERP